ncbi:hypothetical protein BV22DRAFT_1135484 [Leucogyrophana mollusca]|uniref:Uncharacterized protein n=1 Tax=Leucogyrophana mollusca TaxID=85980 RepID=A0ACB8AVG2_9AGAM|nr:hypothetical protein BV22DRAFT_1135484 [Leucogyrophana mollusca]
MQHLPSTPIHTQGDLLETPVRTTISCLASTSAAFLFTSPPIHSTSRIPAYAVETISPLQYQQDRNLLEREPTTEAERQLQDALRELEWCEENAKRKMIGMQAAAVLQTKYCNRVQSQLATQEKKKTKKNGTKLVGDGLPHLLTGDIFVAQWKAAEKARIEWNKAVKVIYETEMAQWEAERDLAKVEKRRTKWNRPKMGPKEKPVPKPEVVQGDEGEDKEDDKEEEGDDDGSMEQ